MTGRSRTLEAGPVGIALTAPPALAFQMLAAVGQGPQAPGDGAEVVERDGDRLVADFRTTIHLPPGRRVVVRTREAVWLRPPDRIEYEHLEGAVRGLREVILVESADGGTCRLVYTGSYDPRGRMDAILFRLVGRRLVERAVRDHFVALRPRCEERARRSVLFRPGAS